MVKQSIQFSKSLIDATLYLLSIHFMTHDLLSSSEMFYIGNYTKNHLYTP